MAARAREENYEHRCHAGNKGDVWKHVILWEILGDLLDARPPSTTERFVYAETHTGQAVYPDVQQLCQYGEGFGMFCEHERWSALSGYFAAELASDSYLGSSALVRRALSSRDVPYELHLWDTCRQVVESLATHYQERTGHNIQINLGDGYRGLLRSELRPGLVLVDPPTADWKGIKRMLRALPSATMACWYPLQSSSGKREVSEQRRKIGRPVFQVQWKQPTGCSHDMVGCGVRVRGASEQCLRRLDEVLRPVAMKLAADAVDSPYQRW